MIARAVAVGAVHGMAGSAAVSLLILATLPSLGAAVAYLLLFGVGTLLGMTALTAVLAWPLALAMRARRARRALATVAGLGSIAFACRPGVDRVRPGLRRRRRAVGPARPPGLDWAGAGPDDRGDPGR
jgi:hypothetical protein